MTELRRLENAKQASEACGRQILDWLREAIAARGGATLAISGGSSPRVMFEMFAKTPFAWRRVHLFWVDERGVPPDHEQSNFRMTNEAWLKEAVKAGTIPGHNVHRIEAELPADVAAERYTADIRQHFGLAAGELPQFDVIHRGMGPDAHTASLFPGEPMIANRTGIAAALWVEKFAQWRITLLPGVLLAPRHTAMLVTGPDKAGPLHSVLHEKFDPMQYPVQLGSSERTVWFLDPPAAAQETN
jgi:6-phosphogluconolactonase